MISIYTKPYPDEFLYSWIYRLAKINRLSLLAFYSGYLGIKNARISSLPIDVRAQFPVLYKNLWETEDIKKMYYDLTTFGFESLFMTDQHAVKYINNIFYKKDSLNPPVNKVIKEIRICPECIKEDTDVFGEPYIHRSHLLSGVCTCHKHGCILHRYLYGANGHACDFDMDSFIPVTIYADTESLRAYTGYTVKMLDNDVSYGIKELKTALMNAIKGHGYDVSDNYASLVDDLENWSYKSLINYKVPHFLKAKMTNLNNIRATEILPLLMYFYPVPPRLEGRTIESVKCDKCGYRYFRISGLSDPLCPSCEYKENMT